MSEEVKPIAPIQDAIEQIYTELGIVIDRRARCAHSPDTTGDQSYFENDIGRLSDALKSLSEVHRW